MTQLREQMIRAMELKNLSKHTQRAYLAAVKGLTRHYHRTPDEITEQMADDYLLYLKSRGQSRGQGKGVDLTPLFFAETTYHSHVK